eukprot:gene18040-27785_t
MSVSTIVAVVAVALAGLLAVVDRYCPYVAYRDPKERRVLSPVIRDAAGWENEGLLLPHEPLRRDFAALRRANELIESGRATPQQRQAFLKWYRTRFAPQLRLHAAAEDAFFFKFFHEKAAEAGVPVVHDRDLAADHARLHYAVEAPVPDEDVIAGLSELTNLFDAHFDEEERLFRPLFATAFNESSWKQSVSDSHRAYTLFEVSIVLPHIAHYMSEWAAPGRQAAFDQSLPFPIRQLLHRVWLPAYYEDYIDKCPV